MTFSLHCKGKNGGGTIVSKFTASSSQLAIKKAEAFLQANPYWIESSTEIVLNRNMRGSRYFPVKVWDL